MNQSTVLRDRDRAQVVGVNRRPSPRARSMRSAKRATIAVLISALAVVSTACLPVPPTPGVSTATVSAGNGFGGGTIYYPTTLTGRAGALVLVPGFTGNQPSVSWYGPLLAQHGFIVFTIDTNSWFDDPASRSTQQLAALDYLTTKSVVAAKVDPARLAVGGHSMGGGGSLQSTVRRPALKAAIALAPWNSATDFSGDRVPTLIVGCQNDTTAAPASHATPFYNSIPTATPKAYLEIAGGDHQCPSTQNDTISRYVVAWMKRFVNGDTSASATLCPAPAAGGPISAYRATCPY